MRRQAGIAGVLYLTVIVTGFFTLVYVPSQLVVPTDAAATARNIEASRALFKVGIIAGIVCYVAFIVLPLSLYRLLSHVHRDAAALMVVFAIVSVPISMLNLGHKLDVLSLLSPAAGPLLPSSAQVHVQVMQSLTAYSNGMLIAEVFWGLWLLPFGYLAFRSTTIPRLLGVCLMLGCFGYLINVSGAVLIEGYGTGAMASIVSLPSAIGEIGTCIWLLLTGFRGSPAVVRRAPAAGGG
ncbi:MAG: DUF4386 domain-containing protein [Gemmatimonadaceae bacterium]|nr:DUF4386 domain-containing protein [Gemmatimonadaceae bacterium]